MKIVDTPLGEIRPYGRNAKKHDAKQVANVAESIRQYGFVQPIVVDGDGVIVIGHCRYAAAKKLGMATVPVVRVDDLTPAQVDALRIVDNKTNESPWDLELLMEDLPRLDLDAFDFDFALPEIKDEADEAEEDGGEQDGAADKEQTPPREEHAKLSDTFIVPPFSILDTRQGDWINRKRQWREIIQDDGSTRGDAQTFSDSLSKWGNSANISLLDPVLAEVIVSWFLPQNQHCNVFDTFAGDTVFGFVAAYKGHTFNGIELREEQAAFNQEQADRFGISATYHCDDGRNVQSYLQPETQDLYFSCPPYFDLEVYSDKENDASNQKTYAEFYAILHEAFRKSIECLKNNRFAVVVASDVRDKKTGGYYDFISDIKHTFSEGGCLLYNEIVLVNVAGSAAIRARNGMRNRKTIRTHQEVLVFYKGDASKIHSIFGDVEAATINDGEDE